MSEIFFSITRSEEFVGATVIIDGEPYPVSKDHPAYDEIAEYLQYGDEPLDAEFLLSLINPFQGVAAGLTRLSERVTIGGNVLFFDGDPIDNSLSEHIVRIFQSGEKRDAGYGNFVKFLEKLMTNPSKKSRRHLYDFATHHKLTINSDGDLLLWKSTNEAGFATRAGYGIVTTPDGQVTVYEKAFLPNALGYVVEIPRDMVDDDRNSACSTGLHVGAFSYASTYSSKLWNVVVNPRDVVAVPHDAASAKIRVCRYTVVGENATKTNFEAPSFTAEDSLPGAPEPVEVKALLTGNPEDKDARVQPLLGVVAPPVATPAGLDRTKIDEFKAAIPGIISAGWTKKMSIYASKKVTAKQRGNFRQALLELGIE